VLNEIYKKGEIVRWNKFKKAHIQVGLKISIRLVRLKLKAQPKAFRVGKIDTENKILKVGPLSVKAANLAAGLSKH